SPPPSPSSTPPVGEAVVVVVKAFSQSRRDRFPETNLAPPEAQLQREAAELLALGRPEDEVAGIVRKVMADLPDGAPAPLSLNFCRRSVQSAAAAAKQRARQTETAAAAGAAAGDGLKGPSKTPEERTRQAAVATWWRKLDLYFRSGIWTNDAGPAPGSAGCKAPDWYVAEIRDKVAADKARFA